MMWLDQLIVSQNGLRNLETVENIEKDVKNGMVLTKENLKDKGTPLIEIVQFPGEIKMIHNGHHRCTAIWLAGRRVLYSDEFFLKKYTLSDYLEVSLGTWVTPFDPETHVRKTDIGDWKRRVEKHRKNYGDDETIKWIYNKFKQYREPREVWTLPEFIRRLQHA